MPNRTLPLNAIDAFLVTARHLNLTHAAKELCLTQGAVSRKIASPLTMALTSKPSRMMRRSFLVPISARAICCLMKR